MVPEGEEKEQKIKDLFEKTMKENFLNLVKEIDIQVQEAWSFPNKMDTKRTTPRHIIIKMPNVKDNRESYFFFKKFYLFYIRESRWWRRWTHCASLHNQS